MYIKEDEMYHRNRSVAYAVFVGIYIGHIYRTYTVLRTETHRRCSEDLIGDDDASRIPLALKVNRTVFESTVKITHIIIRTDNVNNRERTTKKAQPIKKVLCIR